MAAAGFSCGFFKAIMNLTIKRIKRANFSWGLYDSKKKEFIFVYDSKKQCSDKLKELKKEVK